MVGIHRGQCKDVGVGKEMTGSRDFGCIAEGSIYVVRFLGVYGTYSDAPRD